MPKHLSRHATQSLKVLIFLLPTDTILFSNSTDGAATHRISTRAGSLAALHADNPKVPFEREYFSLADVSPHRNRHEEILF